MNIQVTFRNPKDRKVSILAISEQDIVNGHVEPTLQVLRRLSADRSAVLKHRQRVVLAFGNCSGTALDLAANPAIAAFVRRLHEEFQGWFLLLHPESSSLGVVSLAVCGIQRVPGEQPRVDGPALRFFVFECNAAFITTAAHCELSVRLTRQLARAASDYLDGMFEPIEPSADRPILACRN